MAKCKEDQISPSNKSKYFQVGGGGSGGEMGGETDLAIDCSFSDQ